MWSGNNHNRSGAPRLDSKLCALAIMTKAPRAGEVKTRLVPPLTPVEAAEINKCFLRDLANSISVACLNSPGRGIAVYTPVGAESSYEGILPSEFIRLPQRGDDFGEHLYLAAEDLFKLGFKSVCLINSDSPTVPSACFAEAANALAEQGDRIVIGPSDDGGYYLIGIKQQHRRLFQEIAWSTERVFDQTMARAAETGAEVKLLPAGYDVDDPAVLRRLCGELLDDSASDFIAPHTRRFLLELSAERNLRRS